MCECKRCEELERLLACYEADPNHPEPPVVKGALDAQEELERRVALAELRQGRERRTERDAAIRELGAMAERTPPDRIEVLTALRNAAATIRSGTHRKESKVNP